MKTIKSPFACPEPMHLDSSRDSCNRCFYHGGIDTWSTFRIYLWTGVVLNEILTNTIFSSLKDALSNVIFKTSHLIKLTIG